VELKRDVHTHAALGNEGPMDVTTLNQSEFTNRSQERAAAFLHRNPGSITPRAEVSVMILCADPIISAGSAGVLHQCAGFEIVPASEPDNFVCSPPPADVVVADYETAMGLAESAPQWASNLVVFTNHDSETKICRALESGARGYLLHGVAVRELCEGICCVHRGGIALSPLVAARITNRIRGEPLTPREKAVLEQLMLGLSNKVIARTRDLRVGTVKTHVKSILQKLDANSRTAAVVTAQRRGILP
jgi:DNA-binding NarL/FixJ family response regulator